MLFVAPASKFLCRYLELRPSILNLFLCGLIQANVELQRCDSIDPGIVSDLDSSSAPTRSHGNAGDNQQSFFISKGFLSPKILGNQTGVSEGRSMIDSTCSSFFQAS